MTKESQQNMLKTLETTDPALYKELQQAYTSDLEVLGHIPRLPQVKISHGNKLFIFPNEDTVKELKGVVLAVGNFKELYDNTTDEKKAPLCASVNSPYGSKNGLCKECEHWKWGSGNRGTGRACSESRRAIISVKGQPTPFELKVSTTAAVAFDKAMTTAMSATGVPVFLLNFSATLTVEGGGSQKYSLLQPRFEVVSDMNPVMAATRLKLRKVYENYCEEVYGKMNMVGTTDGQQNAVDTSLAEASGGKKASKAKAAGKANDVSDAVVINGDEGLDPIPF